MLIIDLMRSIYKRFEKSSDEPDDTSEDYEIRLEYVNNSISRWENEMGIEWRELFDVLSGTTDANGLFSDQLALAYFKRPAGKLKIGNDFYEYVRPEHVEVEQDMFPSKKIYTVLGSRGSITIQVFPAIAAAFTLNYRKHAHRYTVSSDTVEIEMSDPEYVVHDVVGMLYLDDDNGTQANVEIQIATQKMEAMKLQNELKPFNNSNVMQDADDIAFGR